MSRLLAIAISVLLFSSYVTSQCSNASMRSIEYHCTGCGGGIVFVTVCSGGGGRCDAYRYQIPCGICSIGQAGACLSSSVDKPGSVRRAVMDDRLVVRSAAPSCLASKQGLLEDWVDSGNRSMR